MPSLYELQVGIGHLSLQRVEVGIQATDVLLGALGTVGLGVPPYGVTLTAGGHFLGVTGHGDTHVDGFHTTHIVFWFLQVEEQGIICTHDNTSFMVKQN